MNQRQPNQKEVSFKLLMTAIMAILLMSIVPVLIKWINVDEITLGIVRLAIGAFGITIFILLQKKRVQVNRREIVWLVLLGGVFAAHWYLYFLSIRLTDASLAAIGVSTFGIHLLLLSSVIKRERLSFLDISAVFICIVGIVLASPSLEIDHQKWRGFIISVVSGFLYACLPLINQKISSISTNLRALGQFGFALIFFLFFIPHANFDLDVSAWQGLVVLGVVSTLIAHTLWIKASTELPSSITAVVYYGYVPLTLVLSYFLLQESMNWSKILGAGLIILANIIVVVFHRNSQ